MRIAETSMAAVVSVIIPTYNRASFLKEALDSVLLQQNAEMEVIVVDDGSTDDTAAIVESFGRAVTYLYQSNAGVSAARNTGIKAARGRWLALLDSDDLWLPGKLQFQLELLNRHKDIKICQT
ncbi:MAG: glycosyltransferase family A protein, partial [Desulforhabdus sp.]|nr:glycosyltransferase family A protein [Desulforhabdus sp.]